MMPLISLIIPTFNRTDFLRATLDSVINQDYKNWECIIVDDGSTDNSLEVAQDYSNKDSRIKAYQRPEHLPKSGNSCRNFGFSLAKGEFITFFDSDDVMLPNFLSSRIDLFQPETKIIFATYSTVDEHLNFLIQKKFVLRSNLLQDYMFFRFPIITNSLLIRKSFLVGKELFNPEIKRGQETDFLLNILPDLAKEEYKVFEEPTFLYRQHTNSISSQAKEYNPNFTPSYLHVRKKSLDIALQNNDLVLAQNSYEHIILIVQNIFKNKDFSNLRYFKKILLKINFLSLSQKAEIFTLSTILTVLGRAPKKLQYRWIKFFKL